MVVTKEDNATASQQSEQEMRAFEWRQTQVTQSIADPSMSGEQPSGFLMPNNEVNRVGMRIQEFIPTDPELWFSR